MLCAKTGMKMKPTRAVNCCISPKDRRFGQGKEAEEAYRYDHGPPITDFVTRITSGSQSKDTSDLYTVLETCLPSCSDGVSALGIRRGYTVVSLESGLGEEGGH